MGSGEENDEIVTVTGFHSDMVSKYAKAHLQMAWNFKLIRFAGYVK